MAFNPADESCLAVAGFRDLQVFVLSSRGEVLDRLAVELSLDGEGAEAHILQVGGGDEPGGAGGSRIARRAPLEGRVPPTGVVAGALYCPLSVMMLCTAPSLS